MLPCLVGMETVSAAPRRAREVIPFLEELKYHLGPDQFSASQIGLNDHAADVDRRRFGGHPRAARREQTA